MAIVVGVRHRMSFLFRISGRSRLRGCADRDAIRLCGRRARDARSFGELPKPPEREGACSCARTPTIHHRAHLGTVHGPAARKGDQPPVGLSPLAHTRPGGLREAGSGPGVWLRLPEDRRRVVFGHHASRPTRRVDSLRGDREAAENNARSLRPLHRPGELAEVAVDGCITKAPCGGEKAGKSPVDRGKQGTKRSTAVDGRGIPIGGVTAGANRPDSPLLVPTLEHASASVGGLPERTSVHLDRGYDSNVTRERLKERGLIGEIAQKGKKPAPLAATKRWVIEIV
jgi:hypothetical protein